MKKTILSRRDSTLLTTGFSLRILTVTVALLAALSAEAQHRHQFSVHAGGGLSTFEYKTLAGNTALGFGGALGADYTFFFNNTWGISTGLEAALFNGKYKLPTFNDAYPSYDGEENFEFNYTLTDYNEKQQAILLNIPLMLRFEHGRFYAAAGAKAGIRLHAAYKNSLNELAASGYYPQYDLTLNHPAYMGFGTFHNISNKGDVALKTALFASAEAGIKWGRLHTGLYLDYGLNDINNASARTFGPVRYELPEPAAYQPPSVLASTAGGNNMTDKLRPLAAGIKLTFVIGTSKAKEKPVEPVLPLDTQPVAVAPADDEDERQREEEARRDADIAQKEAEEAQQQAEVQQEAEVQRQVEEVQRQVEEAQQQAEEVQQQAETQRQYDADMRLFEEPISGYAINSINPTSSMKLKLDEAVEILQRYPDLHVQIEGHACSLGSQAVNMRIGQRRADVVKAYFVEKGIAADRMTTSSKGEDEHITSNTTEENRRKNRRIQIIVKN